MRLLTYNIHKGFGGSDRRYRPERIHAVIASVQPDIVCLQEVDRNVRRSHYHDQPAVLAGHYAAAASCFQLNVPHRDGGYGNLILSRWPFRSQHHLCLRQGRRKPRGAQLVIVETPQGPLQLVNWHLGLSERERHWQAVQLLEHPTFRQAAHLATLIAGDFNDWRNTLGRLRFAAHDFHQATIPTRQYRSFPAFMPVAALDKVFYRGAVELHHVQVVKTPLARRASDHLPLVVDFHLNGAASAGAAPVERP